MVEYKHEIEGGGRVFRISICFLQYCHVKPKDNSEKLTNLNEVLRGTAYIAKIIKGKHERILYSEIKPGSSLPSPLKKPNHLFPVSTLFTSFSLCIFR